MKAFHTGIVLLLLSTAALSCLSQAGRLTHDGIEEMDKGRYHQAIFVFNQALEDYPDHEKALYYRGLTYCALQEYDKALADFTKTLSLNEAEVGALINRGIVYALLGKDQKALDDFRKAARYDPDHPKIYSNRGGLYARKGDYSRAIADFTKALEYDPQNKKLLTYRGDMLMGLGKYLEAIVDYARAIKADPKDGDLYRKRANARRLIGATDRAVKDVKKSTALQPKNALSYAILGIIRFKEKKYGRAVANFAQAKGFGAEKVAAELPHAYFYMGEAYRKKNFIEIAMDSYKKFLLLNPAPRLKPLAEKALKELVSQIRKERRK